MQFLSLNGKWKVAQSGKATAQLVIETVSVRDKNGNPVEGLTAKDFTITEDGVAQTIAFCEFQKLDEIVTPTEQAMEPINCI